MSKELKNMSAEISWLDRVIKRYKETGRVIPERQEKLYQKIRDEFVGGKVCIDVGCSLGIGSNMLAHEARFVWGVDINEEAVDFAKKVFRRPNLDFDLYDVENPPSREIAKFEIITMVETLEHLENPDNALNNIKNLFQPTGIGFITIPNIANSLAGERDANNELHLHHWNAGQFYELMTKHFNAVTMYSADKIRDWGMEDTVDGGSQDYLIVAKVESPK